MSREDKQDLVALLARDPGKTPAEICEERDEGYQPGLFTYEAEDTLRQFIHQLMHFIVPERSTRRAPTEAGYVRFVALVEEVAPELLGGRSAVELCEELGIGDRALRLQRSRVRELLSNPEAGPVSARTRRKRA